MSEQPALEDATSYAQQRVTFGRPLAARQGVSFPIVDIFIKHQMGQLFTYRTARR